MARGRQLHRSAGGGEDVQALRRTRARLIPAALAVAVLAAAVAYPAAVAESYSDGIAAVAAVAVALLVAGLALRRASLVPWALAIVGAEYGLRLRLDEAPVDARAVYVAAALVLAAELAYASLGAPLIPVAGGLIRRGAAVVLAVAAGAGVAAVTLAAADVDLEATLGLEAAGVVAAVAALALVALLARSGRGDAR